MTKLRAALRAKYGARCYRITRTGEVHIYGAAPNSCVVCWWLMGDIDTALMWMGVEA
jgi:hypothetical protein